MTDEIIFEFTLFVPIVIEIGRWSKSFYFDVDLGNSENVLSSTIGLFN